MRYRFCFLEKQCAENILPILFEILYSNMSVIAPTSNTYEQDFQLWQSSVAPALSKQQRQIVLMYSDDGHCTDGRDRPGIQAPLRP